MPSAHFSPDDEAGVRSGPFTGFRGTVEKVDDASFRLVVNVAMFGRGAKLKFKVDEIEGIEHSDR